MLRIGVLGASFNPPTKGHSDVVKQALAHFDQVLLVPSASHAFEKKMVPLFYRLQMLDLFLEQWTKEKQGKIKIVNIEAIMQNLQVEEQPIYTYDVLNALDSIYKSFDQPFELHFIMGPDNRDPQVWQKFHRYQEIEQRWHLFIAEENVPVRSSDIRALCEAGYPKATLRKLLQDKLNDNVLEYVLKHQLYAQVTTPEQKVLENKPTDMMIASCAFKLDHHQLQILLEQTEQKGKSYWSLPCVVINAIHSNLEVMVAHNLKSILGTQPHFIEQAITEGYPQDEANWHIAVVYYALCANEKTPAGFEWFNIEDLHNLPLLPFHQALISKCVERLQSKSLYTSLPFFFLKDEFTLTELQKAYEIVLGFKMEKKSFRRRVLDANILIETGNRTHAKHRPAQLYRLNTAEPYVFPRIIEGARKVEATELATD